MILTVGNTKGGVGKTTLALNIAIARALAGRDVWLVDGDRQGTAQAAVTIRGEAGVAPVISCSVYGEGPALRQQVLAQQAKFDDVVIDVGGRDSTALRAALSLTDTLLVPFAPRSFDVWALQDIGRLVDEARSQRDGLTCYAMLNNADVSGMDNKDAVDALADYPQFKFLGVQINRRKSIASAAGSGLSVMEWAPRDHKAIAEVGAVVDALFS